MCNLLWCNEDHGLLVTASDFSVYLIHATCLILQIVTGAVKLQWRVRAWCWKIWVLQFKHLQKKCTVSGINTVIDFCLYSKSHCCLIFPGNPQWDKKSFFQDCPWQDSSSNKRVRNKQRKMDKNIRNKIRIKHEWNYKIMNEISKATG